MTAPELERQERLQVTAADGTTHRFYTHDELQAAITKSETERHSLQARVAELESVFSHLYGQAVWLRGDQAYRDFARAFIKRMSALRIKCVSRQELAKIEGKTE